MNDAFLIEVPAELFNELESSDFSGSARIPFLNVGCDTYVGSGPCLFSVSVTNTGKALLVRGNVEMAAEVACARCLRNCSVKLAGDICAYYFLDSSETIPDDLEGDEYFFLGEQHFIDLEPLVRAALIVSVPYMPLCSPECKGICPGCGADLNTEPCMCEARGALSEIESKLDDERNPFAVLRNYSFEDKNPAYKSCNKEKI